MDFTKENLLKAQAGPDAAGCLDLEGSGGFPPLQVFAKMTTGMHREELTCHWEVG